MNLKRTIKDIKKNGDLILLALPAVLYIFVFSYIPLYGLILPFKNYKYNLGFFKSPWVGFENFKFLFTSDMLYTITRNTILYNLVFIVLGGFVAVSLALMLFELSRRLVKIYQTVMFFPYFISWVVVSYIALAFLDMEHGLFNVILEALGKEPVLWYSVPKYWPVILVLVNIWKGMGYGAILYYAGLMGIDNELFEAAKLDGASRLQQVRYVSLPMLKPLITIMVILQIGRIFYGDFGLFYNVTLDSSMIRSTAEVIDTYVYRSLRQLGDIGMASAAGLYQAVVGFILVLLSNLAVRKINKDYALF
ncbi:MAG TPA: sugar ABC transporter permease [Clostridiaceae bacterium]|nr:sugar ABC transporter permease [Clostridiaceae bacterium]